MSGYGPGDEEEDDFTRLTRELGDVDVGEQQGDPVEKPVRLASAIPAGPAPRDAVAKDDALSRAQGAARAASRRSQLGRAGSDFIAAMGGYKADDSFWDSAEKQGAQGVSDLEKRRASERQTGLDAESKRLHDAQIANYLKPKGNNAGKPVEPVGNLDVIAKFIGVDPKALEGVTPKTLERITGLKIADLNREAAALGREDSQGFTAGQNRLNRETTLKAAESAERIRREKDVEEGATHVGKDLEGTAGLQKSFAMVDQAAAKSPGAGIGWWDSVKPEVFDSAEDTAVKQGLKQIIAVILKKQSGSTVSSDEYNRTLSQYGISRTATPEAFKIGYESMKKAAIASAKEAEARYKPESVERYRKRGGIGSEDFAATPRTPVPPGTSLENDDHFTPEEEARYQELKKSRGAQK